MLNVSLNDWSVGIEKIKSQQMSQKNSAEQVLKSKPFTTGTQATVERVRILKKKACSKNEKNIITF